MTHRGRKFIFAAAAALAAATITAIMASRAACGCAASAPRAVTPPTIGGQLKVGDRLRAIRGKWRSSGRPGVRRVLRYAYRWRACDVFGSSCSDISGARSRSYKLRRRDIGHTIRVVITATNAVGSTRASSAPTRVIGRPFNVVSILDNTRNAGGLYGTFQSHNHRTAYVPGEHAIFVSDLHSWSDDAPCSTAPPTRDDGCHGDVGVWESSDNASTWKRVLDLGIGGHYPPTLEADRAGNVYAFVNSYTGRTGATWVYRFPRGDYGHPRVFTTLPSGASSDKFASAYDPGRNYLYYVKGDYTADHTFRFYTIDASNRSVVSNINLLTQDAGREVTSYTSWDGCQTSGPAHTSHCGTYPHYPLLYDDRPDGMLILAWTTTAWGSPHGYYDFHFLVSPDGGATWIGKAGKIRSFPVPGDDDGPAFRVMAGGEYRPHPLSEQHWLNNVFAQNDMILFAYGDSLGHLYYRRFNWATKTSDVWSGPRSQICGATICEVTQGSFFSRADRPRGRILLTAGTSDHRIATLYSDDDGASWHDHALSRSRTAAFPWAVSGSPTPGPGGEVLGAVTDQSRNQVDFIRTAWR